MRILLLSCFLLVSCGNPSTHSPNLKSGVKTERVEASGLPTVSDCELALAPGANAVRRPQSRPSSVRQIGGFEVLVQDRPRTSSGSAEVLFLPKDPEERDALLLEGNGAYSFSQVVEWNQTSELVVYNVADSRLHRFSVTGSRIKHRCVKIPKLYELGPLIPLNGQLTVISGKADLAGPTKLFRVRHDGGMDAIGELERSRGSRHSWVLGNERVVYSGFKSGRRTCSVDRTDLNDLTTRQVYSGACAKMFEGLVARRYTNGRIVVSHFDPVSSQPTAFELVGDELLVRKVGEASSHGARLCKNGGRWNFEAQCS